MYFEFNFFFKVCCQNAQKDIFIKLDNYFETRYIKKGFIKYNKILNIPNANVRYNPAEYKMHRFKNIFAM